MLTEFIRFFECGSSQCFLGLCNDDNEWVIRLKKIGKNARRLFSEYYCGFLGLNVGLSKPKTSLVSVDFNKIPKLPYNFTNFDRNSPVGVGTQFIPGLKTFPRPTNYNMLLSDPKFPSVNKKHILENLQFDSELSQFYGIIIFVNWAYIADYHKYENLNIDNNGHVKFLDFDLAFSFGGKTWEIPQEYDFSSMMVNFPPFTEGIEEDMNQYTHWFDAINSLSIEESNDFLQNIPTEWQMPSSYLNDLQSFLFTNRDQFISLFKRAASYRMEG